MKVNTANKLSVFRIILVPFFIWSFYLPSDNFYLPLIIFCLASFTDFLDGYLARKNNLVTTFGKFIDPVADKILTLSAFIMLTEFLKLPAWGVCIIVAREIAITGFRIIAASGGVTIAASKMGKIKTVSQMLAIIFSLLELDFSIYLFYISVILTLISGIEYIVKNLQVLDLKNI